MSNEEDEEEAYRYFVSRDVDPIASEQESDNCISIWYQYREFEENVFHRIRQPVLLTSSESVHPLSGMVVPSHILARVVSPSGQLCVQFLKNEVQLWKQSNCLYRIPLSKKPIVEPGKYFLGGYTWSSDEEYVVFGSSRHMLTNDNPPKSSFFSSSSEVRGQQFVVESLEWGEGYTDSSLNQVTMMVLQVSSGDIREIPDLPMAVGQPCCLSSQNIVVTSWEHNPKQKPLGLLYCTNRPSQLISCCNPFFEDGRTQTITVLTPHQVLATNPTKACIQGKQYLVYLGHEKGYQTHFGNMALHAMPITIQKGEDRPQYEVWVPTVNLPKDINDFPGIFTLNLPHTTDNQLYQDETQQYIYINTQWHSSNALIRVHPPTKTIQRVSADAHNVELLSMTSKGHMIIKQSSPTSPPAVQVIFPSLKTPIKLPSLSIPTSPYPTSSSYSSNDDAFFQLLNICSPHYTELTSDLPLQSILLWPSSNASKKEKKKVPLIVFVHGGPHFGVTTKYDPNLAYLSQYGMYAILAINYRGSSGFGQSYLDSLTGRIGTLDVSDVVHVTQTVLRDYPDVIDSNRVGVCGGSHGGYLACHLIGRYPSLFKVAAIRNPVTNVATMTTTTDIPDWCHVETFGAKTTSNKDIANTISIPATADQLAKMYHVSPIQYASKVKSPTLIAIGMKDLRVPPSQGISFYHSLTQLVHNDTKQLLIYPNDSHPISAPTSQADHWIHIRRWFHKHL